MAPNENSFNECLTKPQLEAVLTHELCHIRRRDNLTVAIHMIVEALFWFHPLVWWIGARLVEERERARRRCSALGTEPQVYAEGILKVCKFYVESPLTCVAGVTGNNLKKRMEWIMRNRVGESLSAGKRLLLAITGMLALAIPLTLGFLNVPQIRAQSSQWETAAGGKMQFEVASIRQNTSEKFTPPNFALSSDDSYAPTEGLFSADFPLSAYIEFAYKLWLSPEQAQAMVTHLPKWVATDRFEIHARARGNPNKDQMRLMMQSLLMDRFRLAVHFESQQVPVLALTLVKPGKLGPKLRPNADGTPCDVLVPTPAKGSLANVADVFPPVCGAYMALDVANQKLLGSRNTTMALLASSLASVERLGRPVIDETGLTGKFDFTLQRTPESNSTAPAGAEVQHELQGTTFLEAVQQQLGLKLVPQKGPVNVLVIDHVEQPSEN